MTSFGKEEEEGNKCNEDTNALIKYTIQRQTIYAKYTYLWRV